MTQEEYDKITEEDIINMSGEELEEGYLFEQQEAIAKERLEEMSIDE